MVKFSALLLSLLCFDLDLLRKQANQWFKDQFKPFEHTGFTKEMILGAQELYFSQQFYDKMERIEKPQMVLWTVKDGKIYVKESK